ncbi:hypothetical protein [Streptomyces sp. NPDC002054]|uniref:hypothetical protein n=1 Tax=Streptomyces sp. NPDC002054 TaxID=3154663 RepID=UPI003316B4C0
MPKEIREAGRGQAGEGAIRRAVAIAHGYVQEGSVRYKSPVAAATYRRRAAATRLAPPAPPYRWSPPTPGSARRSTHPGPLGVRDFTGLLRRRPDSRHAGRRPGRFHPAPARRGPARTAGGWCCSTRTRASPVWRGRYASWPRPAAAGCSPPARSPDSIPPCTSPAPGPRTVDEAADLSARLTGIHEIARERHPAPTPALSPIPPPTPFPADADRAQAQVRAQAGGTSHATYRFAARALGLPWQRIPELRTLLGDAGPLPTLH